MPLNPIPVAVLLLGCCRQQQLIEKLTGRHEGLVSPVPLLRFGSGSVADGCRAWVVVAVGVGVGDGGRGCQDPGIRVCLIAWLRPWLGFPNIGLVRVSLNPI